LGFTPANKAGDSSLGIFEFQQGANGGVRFVSSNQTDATDGVISAGRFASGLNIVGSQTTAGTGRQIRMWGSVIDDNGVSFVKNSGTWGINVTGSAATATTATNQSGGTVNATTGSFSSTVTLGVNASIRQSSSNWTGNPGSGVGKLEYHSNRWYVVAGSNSAEIARFRRDGGDVGHIANDGRLNFPFWSTTGRNYSNEWIQFDNHSGLYSPLNNAHFYPNNGSYGSWRIAGTRNGWGGLEFDGSTTNVSLMSESNGNTVGWHANSFGWKFRVTGGTAYVSKGFWGGGADGMVLDTANAGWCRAWVDFNGTGSVAIRAGFNVSSISDNGVGDYTVNLASSVGDGNYAVVITHTAEAPGTARSHPAIAGSHSGATTKTATNIRINTGYRYGLSETSDTAVVCVALFR
jgi:hypothetical protein